MKARLFAVAVLGLALVVPFAANALDDGKTAFKAACPISGKPADITKAVAFHGKHVFFCCDNCPKAFEKKVADKENRDPKLMAKVAHQLLATGQVTQVACPFTGKEVNEKTLVSFNGAKVGFCCNNCKGKFAKASDSEKLAMAFGHDAFKKGFALQTRCPISGKAITASVSTERDGKQVYFCCEGCVKPFNSDPAKFTASLAAAKLTFKSGSCCDKASKGGKVCSHGCCTEAVAAGKACSKCNAI